MCVCGKTNKILATDFPVTHITDALMANGNSPENNTFAVFDPKQTQVGRSLSLCVCVGRDSPGRTPARGRLARCRGGWLAC